jgi:hypothetical protein
LKRNVTIRDGHGETLLSGIDAVRGVYADWFAAHPDVHADVTGRRTSGAWVVDEERITMTDAVMSAVVCYHLSGDVIDAVLLLSEET